MKHINEKNFDILNGTENSNNKLASFKGQLLKQEKRGDGELIKYYTKRIEFYIKYLLIDNN